MTTPGGRMAAEMREQPAVVARLAARRQELVAALRASLPDDLRGIVLIARGSSDHAAVYGRYVLEVASGLPVALAAPSLHTLYRAPVHYDGYLAVAVSQSGRTPEIVTVLRSAMEAGATGVSITNELDTPLGATGDVVLHLDAGQEQAVPATKTFTGQLVAFAFLAEALAARSGRGLPWRGADWDRVPDVVAGVLDDEDPAHRVAADIGDAPGLIAVGRGYLFAIALEAALKLKETASILAQGYSAADLRHGPIAVIEEDFPVLALHAPGPTAEDMHDLVERLRQRRARVVEIAPSDAAAARRRTVELGYRPGLPEPLQAVPAVVRAQQVAYALALHRGYDPDRPHGLTKVTPTS